MIGNAWSKTWTSITPLPHCELFKIEYHKRGNYQLRYRPYADAPYHYLKKEIDDINNLSQLADKLIEASYNYCPLEFERETLNGEHNCLPQYITRDDFSASFITLYESIISQLSSTESCDNVISLINLQNKISDLNDKQLLKFNSSFSMLKIFANSATDKMIDHFNSCGGRKNSAKFIENIILLEAKKACVFPGPPGFMSIAQAHLIAQDISSDYQGSNLIELNSKKNQIKKKAVLEFSKKILENKLDRLIGPKKNHDVFISQLKSYQKLQRTQDSKILDQLKYGFSQDITFDVIEKGLPQMIDYSFKSQFPKTMSLKQRKQFIATKILPQIRANFKKCTRPYKKRINYPSYAVKNDDVLEHRKRLSRDYCQKNPVQCHKKDCSGRLNFLTERKDIKDINVIQACLFPNFARALAPLLGEKLDQVFNKMNHILKFDQQQREQYKKEGHQKIISCADKRIKQLSKDRSSESFMQRPEQLLTLEATEFSQILKGCGEELQNEMTRDIAIKYISSLPQVKSQYGQLKIRDGHINYAKELIDQTLLKCYEAQRKKGVEVVNTITCRPLIEISVASDIIKDQLNINLSKADVSKEKTQEIVSQFKTCSSNSYDSVLKSYHNDKHPTPIKDTESAESYLSSNPVFYECVKKSIHNTSEVITQKKLKKLADDLKEKVVDPHYIDEIIPKIEKDIIQCLGHSLEEIPNWGVFLKMNETSKSGLAQIKNKCIDKATNFALPKIVSNELSKNIHLLKKQNMTQYSLNDFTKLMAKSSSIMSNRDHQNVESMTRASFQAYKRQNPKSSNEDFIKSFSEKAQVLILKDVREALVERIINASKPQYDFSFLKKELSLQCLEKFYSYNQENLKLLKPTSSKESSVDLQTRLVELIKNGLIKAKKSNRLSQFKDTLIKLCQSPEDYRDIKKLVDTGIADDMILQTLEDKTKSSFKNSMQKQCLKALDEFKDLIVYQERKQACSTNSEDLYAFQSKLGHIKSRFKHYQNKPSEKYIMFDFAFQRHLKSIKVIESKLNAQLIDHLFKDNRNLLNSIYANFPAVVKKDSKTLKQITEKIIRDLFQDSTSDSFASQFIEIQLTGAIGQQAHAQAKEQLQTALKNRNWIQKIPGISKKIENMARPTFYQVWNDQGLNSYLDWDNLSDRKRKDLIDSVVEFNILVNLDSNSTDKQKKKSRDKLTQIVTQHIYEHRPFKNEKYRKNTHGRAKRGQSGKKKYLNMPEKMAEDIAKAIRANIEKELGQ